MSKKTGFKQGRLGIGTNNPKYPLDVIGDIRLTGAIRDGSGRLIVTTANSNQNAELYNGWKNDASGNLYLAEPGQVMKIGINKIPIGTSSALDISGGLIIDKLYSKNGNQDFNTESILEFKNLYVKNKLSNQAGEIKDTDISSTSLDDGQTGWLWTANNYLKSEPGIQTIDISADVIMDGITRNEDHKIKVEKSLFAKNVDVMTNKITANNDLNLNGMMTVSNDFTLTDNLNVNNIDISTNLTVKGNLKSEHVLFTKQTTIHDLLDASNIDVSNAVVNNDTIVEKSIHATGDVTSNDVSCNNLFITNELTATHIDISNNLLIRPQQLKEIDIENKATVLKTVDVSYVRVYTDMDVSENMVIDGNMDISAGKLNKHLDVSGIYVKKRGTIKNLKIREKAVMKGQVDISGNLNMINRLFVSSMMGMIGWFASENIPPGWLVCDGGKYTKALYMDLSNCIGNTYNAQDTNGDISFNVPDLTNRFIRSIYTDTDTDIRLGAKENYKTGKPTGDPNFHVTLSGEHIHDVDLSGSHSHDYEYNETNSEVASYYINNSDTSYNGKTLHPNIPNNRKLYSGLITIPDYTNNHSNNYSSTNDNIWNGRGPGDWGGRKYWWYWNGVGAIPPENNYDRYHTIQNGLYLKSKVRKHTKTEFKSSYKTTSGNFDYYRVIPSSMLNSDLNFINGSSTSNKDITFDNSGNHTHIVDDKENTHSHTLSNWDTESVPKHTILLPCIKY
jgi:sulfur carrier protein ThiS